MTDTTNTAAGPTGPPPTGARHAVPMTLNTLIDTIATRDAITTDEALAQVWRRGSPTNNDATDKP